MAVAQRARRTRSDARLAVRLNREAKQVIEKAASACGQSVTDFTVATLLRSANDVLEQQQHIHLSDRDRDRFLAALDSNAQPNEALRRAAERYKQQFS